MAESIHGHTIEIGCTKPSETPKHTLLNSSVIYAEYLNEELLYPNNVLEKWKRELEIIRSRKDIKLRKNRSPVTTPVNDEPKHEIIKNIKNKNSFTILPYEKGVSDKTPVENHQKKSRENRVKKSLHNETKYIQKSNKPDKKLLTVEKPKPMPSTKKTQSLKKKTVICKLNNNK